MRAAIGVGGAAALAVTTLVYVPAAAAAVPAFPDNLVVFPDRDFVTVEGYQDHVGETATLTVTRGTQVMGSAKAEVEAGDVAFEVNHPGGACWGQNTDLKVTPDIRQGDVVSISFEDGTGGETTTSSATVTEELSLDGSTLTVTGSYGPEVDPTQMEQRIVNPDLVDTDVARRDIRATESTLTPAPKGGYSSMLEAADGTFTATYEFDTAATAQIAAGSDGARAMSWEETDPDGNRQGLTIAEFGELGGPGMGGCPAGPGQQEAPAGTATATRSADKSSMQVRWTPVAPQPGAAAVTGYQVALVGDAVVGGQRTLVGRTTGPDATQTTISDLAVDEAYTVQVRSQTGTKLSDAFGTNTEGSVPGNASGDTTAPTLTLTPTLGSTAVETATVEASLNEAGEIYYTLTPVGDDAEPVTSAGLPSDKAILYTDPITITEAAHLKVAGFDRAGNIDLAEGDVTPAPVTEPVQLATPVIGQDPTMTQTSARLSWGLVDGADQYTVTTTPADSGPMVSRSDGTLVSGLKPGTTYTFEVVASGPNAGDSDPLMLSGVTANATDRVTIGRAQFKTGDFRIEGTGSLPGATITVYPADAVGVAGRVIATTVVAAPVAPATVGDWGIRLRNAAAGTNPGSIVAVSSGGGQSTAVTVTAR
ncbi:MAG: fibronectin type III domain-containing protein [Nocardioidaceae bacterium]